MLHNTSHMSSLFLTSQRTKRVKSMKKSARFEKENAGWWAMRTMGEDNILGRVTTKAEVLVDLQHQVAGFMDFLKRTGRNVPE